MERSDAKSLDSFFKYEGGKKENKSESYFLPCALILKGLGLTEADLHRDIATIKVDFLLKIISEIAKFQKFDETYYSENYRDIEGARLSGVVPSLHSHFVETGYLEGRLPYEIPFDADWYYSHYVDLADVYAAHDAVGLRQHFVNTGHLEGRAGTAATLSEAERWQGWLAGARAA